MGWFSKKKRSHTCPIYNSIMEGELINNPHLRTHVQQIPSGQGEASGQYTWDCACGPAGLKWPYPMNAAAGLAMHFNQKHGIPLLD